jgi:hypothetical protein
MVMVRQGCSKGIDKLFNFGNDECVPKMKTALCLANLRLEVNIGDTLHVRVTPTRDLVAVFPLTPWSCAYFAQRTGKMFDVDKNNSPGEQNLQLPDPQENGLGSVTEKY